MDDLPFGVPDEAVTTEIDATAYLEQKLAAMRAHATQIAVDSPFFAFSDNVGQRAFGREHYTLLAGPRGGQRADYRETDLFGGELAFQWWKMRRRSAASLGQPQPGHPGSRQPGLGQPRPGSIQPRATRPAGGGSVPATRCCSCSGSPRASIGSFHYSGGARAHPRGRPGLRRADPGDVPARPPGECAGQLAGLMPAVGWFAASFVLAMRTPGGSIVITNTDRGQMVPVRRGTVRSRRGGRLLFCRIASAAPLRLAAHGRQAALRAPTHTEARFVMPVDNAAFRHAAGEVPQRHPGGLHQPGRELARDDRERVHVRVAGAAACAVLRGEDHAFSRCCACGGGVVRPRYSTMTPRRSRAGWPPAGGRWKASSTRSRTIPGRLTGVPILDAALAALECRTTAVLRRRRSQHRGRRGRRGQRAAGAGRGSRSSTTPAAIAASPDRDQWPGVACWVVRCPCVGSGPRARRTVLAGCGS